MDNALLVALTSILSASIAGGITIWSKHLDNVHKKNEQLMILKNTYVNKKIEAGQKFVARNNVLIYNNYYKIALTDDMIKTGIANQDLIKAIDEIHVSIKDFYLKQDDFSELYFDIYDLNKQYDMITDELSIEGFKMTESEMNSPKFIEQAKIVISYYKKLVEIISESNKMVRMELKEYDIK